MKIALICVYKINRHSFRLETVERFHGAPPKNMRDSRENDSFPSVDLTFPESFLERWTTRNTSDSLSFFFFSVLTICLIIFWKIGIARISAVLPVCRTTVGKYLHFD